MQGSRWGDWTGCTFDAFHNLWELLFKFWHLVLEQWQELNWNGAGFSGTAALAGLRLLTAPHKRGGTSRSDKLATTIWLATEHLMVRRPFPIVSTLGADDVLPLAGKWRKEGHGFRRIIVALVLNH